jgi:hypothetical protein
MYDPIHVLDEARTGPDWDKVNIFTMRCGAQCFWMGDGDPVPWLDWYLEQNADKATCILCIAGTPDCLDATREAEHV